jgi:hypothetical protein
VKRKEPLKLMPLDELKKVLADIVPPVKPKPQAKKRPAPERQG